MPREYARQALMRGLDYEAKLGANPFKFGMIGSTDSHTSLATTREDDRTVRVWGVQDNDLVWELKGHAPSNHEMNSHHALTCCYSPDGTSLVVNAGLKKPGESPAITTRSSRSRANSAAHWRGQPTIHSGEGIATNGLLLNQVLALVNGQE